MGSPERIGAKRLVVGAHYGIGDFVIQRVTAVINAIYAVVLFVGILMMPGFTYEAWRNLFTFSVGGFPLGQLLATLAFFLAGLARLHWGTRHLDGLCQAHRYSAGITGTDCSVVGGFGYLFCRHSLGSLNRGC